MIPMSSQGVPPPPPPAKDASTVVLLRDGAAGLEVMMVRRKRGAAFMAEAYVFPGGRVEMEDEASHPVRGEGELGSDEVIAEIGGDRAHAVTCAVAAIRELFEEAGVLLAFGEKGKPVHHNQWKFFLEGRQAVHAGQRGFREWLAEGDLTLALGELVFFARWVTPESEGRRFDARFYLARMPEEQVAVADESEVGELRWATPQAFLDDPTVRLPPPTRWHLTDLAAHRTVESALGWARAHKVATVRPKLTALDGVIAIVLPWDPEYSRLPGGGTPIAREHPVAGPITRFLLVDGDWQGRTG